MGYVIIGRGSKSGLVCCYKGKDGLRMIVLNAVAQPTNTQLNQYNEWFEEMEHFDRPESAENDDSTTKNRSQECQNQ